MQSTKEGGHGFEATSLAKCIVKICNLKVNIKNEFVDTLAQMPMTNVYHS